MLPQGWCWTLRLKLGTFLCPFLGNVLKLSPAETLMAGSEPRGYTQGWRGLMPVTSLQGELQSRMGGEGPEGELLSGMALWYLNTASLCPLPVLLLPREAAGEEGLLGCSGPSCH